MKSTAQHWHASNQIIWEQQKSPLVKWFDLLRKTDWTLSNTERQQVIFSWCTYYYVYLCLSCRCRAGCSCMARHSTCHPRGRWSPRSPPLLQRSYPAGSPSSSHIPAWQQTTGFSICFSFVIYVSLPISHLLSKDEHSFLFQVKVICKIDCKILYKQWGHSLNQKDLK